MMYDVIISGAGPAGSKCAEIIAKNGFKVALIEKNTNWRKPCGGIVSSRIHKYYPQLRKLNFQKINSISMYSADFHNFKYTWKNLMDPAINVDRLEFDNTIRNIAIDAGAELFDENLSFDFKTKNTQNIGIKTKTPAGIKEYFGKIIIIADGMRSRLAIKSGLRGKWKMNEIYTCKCAIMEGKNLLDKESNYFFFRPYKGYGWIIPLGENKFNIGAGLKEELNLRYNVNEIFIEFLQDPKIKKFLPSSNYKEIWKAAYPLPALGVKENCLFGDNIMIIGDAAGFVSPISGEGIHASIVSGNIAAETAIMALNNENITRETLKRYKSHPYIKKIIRNFKLKVSLTNFLFANKGRNLSKLFRLAEKNNNFREELVNMFLFNQAPSKELLLNLK
ncbi:MAG: geranylgeranyl reductase family protein [Promethearchaeota archaeon]